MELRKARKSEKREDCDYSDESNSINYLFNK